MTTLGQRYFTPVAFLVDNNGVPIVGAQLFFYITSTSTALDTYQDAGLTTRNTNPVVADSNGNFGAIWLTPSTAYKVLAYGANTTGIPSTPSAPQGTEIWAADPVGPAASGVQQTVAGIIGEVRDFAGPSASIPNQWYACYGQAVSRTTYAALFAIIGTAWGAGDGTTTFNLPDLRGRATFGLDNMGGSAASRVTAGVSGIAGTTLGGTGGNQHAQQDTLTATTTVVITDTGHLHSIVAAILNATSGTPTGVNGAVGGSSQLYANPTTVTATTGITAAATTTVTSALTGSSQNMPPTGMVNKIIYAGA